MNGVQEIKITWVNMGLWAYIRWKFFAYSIVWRRCPESQRLNVLNDWLEMTTDRIPMEKD